MRSVSPSGPSRLRAISSSSRELGSGAGRRWMVAASSARPRPCSAARARQSSRSAARSTCSLRSRVSSAATWAAQKPLVACSSMCSTTCARRVENASITLRGTPFEVGEAFVRRLPLDAERAGELGAQVGLVEVAGGEPVGLEDRLAVERAPLAVAGAAGHVARRSRACAGAGPARARCGAGRRRRRTPPRARGSTPPVPRRTTQASSSR